MSLNLLEIIGNIFYNDKKEEAEETQKKEALQQTTNNVFGLGTNNNTNTMQSIQDRSNNLLNDLVAKNKSLVTNNTPTIDINNSSLNGPTIDIGASSPQKPAIDFSKLKINGPTIDFSKFQNRQTSQATADNTSTPQTTTEPESTSKTESTQITNNAIADAAQKYIGTPYVWGGESMEEGGMDCSGFVYKALKDAGYNVGRTTAQGYRSYGKSVSKSEMQAGDLIFYGKGGEASHIGIYIGNGQVIHSSGGSKNTKSNPGKGVIISNVDHRSDFIEARRI